MGVPPATPNSHWWTARSLALLLHSSDRGAMKCDQIPAKILCTLGKMKNINKKYFNIFYNNHDFLLPDKRHNSNCHRISAILSLPFSDTRAVSFLNFSSHCTCLGQQSAPATHNLTFPSCPQHPDRKSTSSITCESRRM